MMRAKRPQSSGTGIGLEVWIARATRGLCDDARQRLTLEYRDHFALALSEARAAGLSVIDALEAAEASLGNPRQVNRAARNNFFTRGEMHKINSLSCRSWSNTWINLLFAAAYLVLAYLFLSLLDPGNGPSGAWWAVFWGMLGIQSAFRMVAPRLPLRKAIIGDTVVMLLLIPSLPYYWVSLGSVLGISLPASDTHVFMIVAVGHAIWIATVVEFESNLLRKLEKQRA